MILYSVLDSGSAVIIRGGVGPAGFIFLSRRPFDR